MEEFQRRLCIDAPPRFGGDPHGKTKNAADYGHSFWGQTGDTDDISTLLDRHRPPVVVDSDGG